MKKRRILTIVLLIAQLAISCSGPITSESNNIVLYKDIDLEARTDAYKNTLVLSINNFKIEAISEDEYKITFELFFRNGSSQDVYIMRPIHQTSVKNGNVFIEIEAVNPQIDLVNNQYEYSIENELELDDFILLKSQQVLKEVIVVEVVLEDLAEIIDAEITALYINTSVGVRIPPTEWMTEDQLIAFQPSKIESADEYLAWYEANLKVIDLNAWVGVEFTSYRIESDDVQLIN